MFPRWQTVAERWPTSGGQIVGFRDRTHSTQLRLWFVDG